MARVVFDASAVIALLSCERGSDVIADYAGDGLISTVNLQEVIHALLRQGFDHAVVVEMIAKLHLEVRPHSQADAWQAAALGAATRTIGSGLGDRSCMALAIDEGLPALTTDRQWQHLAIDGLEVLLAR